jgi:hypothetical protein
MHSNPDPGPFSRLDRETYDPLGYRRTTLMRGVLWVVGALVAAAALAASLPYWGGADFPVASVVIYVAGMVFITMPLCMLHEWLLQAHEQKIARAKQSQGPVFGSAMSSPV